MITKKLFCFFVALILSCSVFVSANQNEISSKEKETIETIEQILSHLHSDKGQKVWPGFDMLSSPVIVWLDNGHLFAFNLKSSHPAWEEIQVHQSRVKFSAKDLWGIKEVPMNPNFNMDGEEAYVFHLDTSHGDADLQFLIFIHERFHSFQFENFVPENHLDGYKKHTDVENLSLILLEEYVLLDFLTANTSQKLSYIKDFAAIHQLRMKKLDADSIRWERNQQRMEGLADYVSFKTLDQPSILPLFSSQRFLYGNVFSYTKDPDLFDLAIKRRHYGVGASLAYALDFLKAKEWKEKVVAGSNLDELLETELRLSIEETLARVPAIKERYDYSEIQQGISAHIREYQSQIDSIMDKNSNQKGVSVVLHKPKNKGVSGGGQNMKMYWLSDGSTLSVGNSSRSATSDRKWEIKLVEVPFLLNGKQGESNFKLENNIKIKIDNETYPLKKLLASSDEKHFREISWISPQCEFRSVDHDGRLRYENNQLIIDFN